MAIYVLCKMRVQMMNWRGSLFKHHDYISFRFFYLCLCRWYTFELCQSKLSDSPPYATPNAIYIVKQRVNCRSWALHKCWREKSNSEHDYTHNSYKIAMWCVYTCSSTHSNVYVHVQCMQLLLFHGTYSVFLYLYCIILHVYVGKCYVHSGY